MDTDNFYNSDDIMTSLLKKLSIFIKIGVIKRYGVCLASFQIVDRIRRQSSSASCELCTHRRRDETRQFRRVGGVYWALPAPYVVFVLNVTESWCIQTAHGVSVYLFMTSVPQTLPVFQEHCRCRTQLCTLSAVKGHHFYFRNNLARRRPILIILSLPHSQMECRKSWNKICHFASNSTVQVYSMSFKSSVMQNR